MKRKDQKEDEETLNFEINEEDDDEQELELLEENRLKVFRKHTELTHIEPDYNSDTSDEDTLGNIPIHWYDEFDHLGYDIHGKKIPKPTEGDKLDDFIDNQNYILDKYNNKIYLKKEELELIKKIGSREFLEIDPYEDQIEFFSSNVEVMPLSGAHEPKSRFIPSKQEARKIMKLARRIQKGYGRVDHNKVQSDFKYYDIWAGDNQISRDKIQAPKVALPQHLESYNPPEEYILSKEEEEEWKGLDAEDRPHNFLPKKHSTLREVKQYERFIQERFERCLDLYLCPRTIKQKIDIDPDSLIPKLPSPKDLKPFPTKLSITYKGHSQRVRSISVDPSGRYLCSGGDDKTVRVWEISSGRNLKTFEFENIVMNVSWNPNSEISLVAVSTGNEVVLINPGVFNDEINQDTLDFVSSGVNEVCENKNTQWIKASEVQESKGHYINIRVEDNITSVEWHRKGDYFATVSSKANSTAVQIHQITKRTTQSPFKKSNGLVQKVMFHPSRPYLFVCTQQSIKIYNLIKQELLKRLIPGAKWISSIDIHPGGDNLIVGTFDKRVFWFDMDLSNKPFKTLRYHKQAVRQVRYHRRYPLFCSASDDGKILIFHGMVYNDLLQNPLIVPVKSIDAHEVTGSLGCLDIEWHPKQPWIFTSGADALIKLYT